MQKKDFIDKILILKTKRTVQTKSNNALKGIFSPVTPTIS